MTGVGPVPRTPAAIPTSRGIQHLRFPPPFFCRFKPWPPFAVGQPIDRCACIARRAASHRGAAHAWGGLPPSVVAVPAVVVEASADGHEWVEVPFRYAPYVETRAPRRTAPHQPRLDWQMWFAALGSYDQNPWFLHLLHKLLLGYAAALPTPHGATIRRAAASPNPHTVSSLLALESPCHLGAARTDARVAAAAPELTRSIDALTRPSQRTRSACPARCAALCLRRHRAAAPRARLSLPLRLYAPPLGVGGARARRGAHQRLRRPLRLRLLLRRRRLLLPRHRLARPV
eukprot:4988264-Prymnesium_polylepis.1